MSNEKNAAGIVGAHGGAPLKVGILAADLTHKDGWAHYGTSLVQALHDKGVSLTVIAARNSPSNNPPNSPTLAGIDVLSILPTVDPFEGGMLVKLARALPQVRSALRGCDLIHCTVEPYAPLAALAALSAGNRPLILTGHGSYVTTPQQRGFPVGGLYGWAYRRSLMVCVSHYTERIAQKTLPGLRTTVVNNGVDFDRFGAVNHVGSGGILCVGAVKARKGQLDLMRALAHVPDAKCTIVGSLTLEPEYAAQVRDTIARLGLADRVTLTGRIPDAELMRYYAEADIFVMASRNVGWKFEGFGLTLLEASAASLPVIGTRDCGAEDAVIDGETGLLVDQTDLEHGLADAIRRLLSDPTLAATMGAAGRAYAATQTWDQVAETMIGLYKSAVSD